MGNYLVALGLVAAGALAGLAAFIVLFIAIVRKNKRLGRLAAWILVASVAAAGLGAGVGVRQGYRDLKSAADTARAKMRQSCRATKSAGSAAKSKADSAIASAARSAFMGAVKWLIDAGTADDLFNTLKEAKAGNESNARCWFTMGTGLELPAQAKYLGGRDYFGWWSDISIAVQTPLEFKAQLDRALPREGDASGMQADAGVLADLPRWNTAISAQGVVFYSITTGNIDEGGFHTMIALDAQGVMYCHIVEYVP
ncbi:MAG: hypothetical protein LLG01_04735 [Planctomycetaceae bacterium]|nr:hypothetical protein [Planctomycetaceae bacterium]